MNRFNPAPKPLLGGSLLAALAASLCCITPLLAVVGGLGGAASDFAWLEPYRLYLAGLTVAVLAFAWFRQLQPKPADCCGVPEKAPFMQSTGFLSGVTILAAALLSFPYYGATLYPAARPNAQALAPTAAAPIWRTSTYRIGGMTCQACAQHVEHAVQQVLGVQAVTVSYYRATAQVRYNVAQAQPAQVEQAINGTGYHVLNSTASH